MFVLLGLSEKTVNPSKNRVEALGVQERTFSNRSKDFPQCQLYVRRVGRLV